MLSACARSEASTQFQGASQTVAVSDMLASFNAAKAKDAQLAEQVTQLRQSKLASTVQALAAYASDDSVSVDGHLYSDSRLRLAQSHQSRDFDRTIGSLVGFLRNNDALKDTLDEAAVRSLLSPASAEPKTVAELAKDLNTGLLLSAALAYQYKLPLSGAQLVGPLGGALIGATVATMALDATAEGLNVQNQQRNAQTAQQNAGTAQTNLQTAQTASRRATEEPPAASCHQADSTHTSSTEGQTTVLNNASFKCTCLRAVCSWIRA